MLLDTEFVLCKTKPSEKWIRKRKYTTAVFMIQSVLVGLQYPIFLLTQWAYINHMLNSGNPKLIYSLSTSAYFISTVISPLIIQKIGGKNKNIWQTLLGINLLVALGNFIYSLSFSTSAVILGRLLSGSSESMKYIMFGEVSRCYIEENGNAVFIWLGILSNMGLLLAPLINFAFKYVNINIGILKITHLNFVGIFMALMFLLISFLVCFLVSNCSAEYDVTEEICDLEDVKDATITYSKGQLIINKNQDQKKYVENVLPDCYTNGNILTRKDLNVSCDSIYPSECNETTRLIKPTRSNSLVDRDYVSLFTDVNFIFVLLSSFFIWFLISCFDNLQPVFILTSVKWDFTELNIVLLCDGLFTLVIIFYMNSRLFSLNTLYYYFMQALLLLVCCIVIMILSFHFGGQTFLTYVISIVAVGLTFGVGSVIPEIYLMSLTSHVTVSDQLRSFAAAGRSYSSKLGAISGFLTSIYLYDYVGTVGGVLLGIVVSLFIFSIIKKDRFRGKLNVEKVTFL